MTTDTDRDEQRANIRQYLISQAEHHDWWELWPRVVGARTEFLDTLAPVSQEQAAWRPAPNDWTILEIAHHALNSSLGVRGLVESLARGEAGQRGESRESGEPGGATSIAELRRDLTTDATAWAGLIDRLPSQPAYEGTSPHMFFGELNCRAWYLFQRIHDRDHKNQIDQVRDAEGFPTA
jgi:hypothetical protein